MNMGVRLTVCVMAPPEAMGATLITDIWAAARPAAIGTAEMYFIMTKLTGLRAKGTSRLHCKLIK